eukprot:CFRG1294T1
MEGAGLEVIERLSRVVNCSGKTVELSNSYILRATEAHGVTSTCYRRLLDALPRLNDVKNQVRLQEQTLTALHEVIEEYLRKITQFAEQDNGQMQREMKDVLGQLRNVTIDPSFTHSNTMVGHSQSQLGKPITLCDYVDDMSVNSIEERATLASNKLQRAYRSLAFLAKKIKWNADRLVDMSSGLDTSIGVFDSSNTQGDVEESQWRMRRMEIFHSELLGKKAEVLRILRQAETLHRDGREIPLDGAVMDGFRRQSQAMKVNLSNMYSDLQYIVDVGVDASTKLKRCSSVHDAFVSWFHESTAIAHDIHNILRDWQAVQTEVQKLQNESLEAINEGAELTVWYKMFLQSYEELLYEIERRRGRLQSMQNMVAQMNRQLRQLSAEESQAREVFLSTYFPYLPEQLCTGLQDPMPLPQIDDSKLLDNLPQLSTPLPSSSTELRRIQRAADVASDKK